MAGVQLIVANSYSLDPLRAAQAERAALAGRDRLNSRDRILLDAFVGDVPSIREMLLMWDSAVALMPDRKTVRFLWADYLFHYGEAMGEVGAMARAEGGFREVLNLDPNHAPAQAHLFELAALGEEVSSAIEIGHAYVADTTRDYLPYYQWRLDLLEGVASLEALENAWADMDEGSLYRIFLSAQTDGHDIEYAALVAEERLRRRADLRSAYHDLRRLALNRGRPHEAAEIRTRIRSLGPEKYDPLIDVFDALYWGGDVSAAERAVLGRGHVDRAPPATDVTLPGSPNFVDACAVGLWRVATGQLEAAPPLVETLRDYSIELEGTDITTASVCSEIIDTQLAFATGRDGTDVMLVRLDSLSRQQLFTVRDIRVALNLTLAKLLEESGTSRERSTFSAGVVTGRAAPSRGCPTSCTKRLGWQRWSAIGSGPSGRPSFTSTSGATLSRRIWPKQTACGSAFDSYAWVRDSRWREAPSSGAALWFRV